MSGFVESHHWLFYDYLTSFLTQATHDFSIWCFLDATITEHQPIKARRINAYQRSSSIDKYEISENDFYENLSSKTCLVLLFGFLPLSFFLSRFRLLPQNIPSHSKHDIIVCLLFCRCDFYFLKTDLWNFKQSLTKIVSRIFEFLEFWFFFVFH